MPTKQNNRIVINLKAVSYAWFFYRNQYGNTCIENADMDGGFTVRGQVYMNDELAFGSNQTCYETAKELGIIDIWQPVFRCRMSASDVLEFTGPRALSLWEAWKAKQFGSKENKK